MTARYTRGLRIRTKCVTIEQLVAWFHRFCDDTSIFIATQSPRPEGLDTAFSVDLADGEPALTGEGVVKATWTTRDNRFKAPGMQIELRSMTKPSKLVFQQMLIARAVSEDAAALPKQNWGEDITEVGMPTFDELAANGVAQPAQLAAAAHAAKDSKGKHTLIGLPAIPMKPSAPKPAVTISIARTEAAPKIDQIMPRATTRMGSIAFAVPSKIAPVAAKKGPVVITTLRPTPATATPVATQPLVSGLAARAATPVATEPSAATAPAATAVSVATAASEPASAAPAVATAAADPVAAIAPEAAGAVATAASVASRSAKPLRVTSPLGVRTQALLSNAPAQATPPAASTPSRVTQPLGVSTQAAASSAPAQAAVSSTPSRPTGSSTPSRVTQPLGVSTQAPASSTPARTSARSAFSTPVRGTAALASMAMRAPAPPAPEQEPAPLARGSSTPMPAALPPQSAQPPPAAPASASSIPSVRGTSPSPTVAAPAADAVPVSTEQASTRVPRAATTLGSGPVARMPAVIYDAELPDVDDEELAPETTDVDPQPHLVTRADEITNVDAKPIVSTGERLGAAPVAATPLDTHASVPALSSEHAPVAATMAAEHLALTAPEHAATAAEQLAMPSASHELDAVPVISHVTPTRAKSEPTWDELAASSGPTHVNPAANVAGQLAERLGASPLLDGTAAAMTDSRSRPDSSSPDADQALPLPPAPDVGLPAVAVGASSSELAPRRRRGLRVAVTAIAFVSAAAAAALVVGFGPWSFLDEPSPVPAPSVVAMTESDIEIEGPPPAVQGGDVVAAVAEDPPLIPDPPVAEASTAAPVAEPSVAPPPVAEKPAIAAPDSSASGAPAEPIAAPRAEPAATKIAKQPARVKRLVAKPKITRAKPRPKKSKKAVCKELSCL
jgi:hypothetical protein